MHPNMHERIFYGKRNYARSHLPHRAMTSENMHMRKQRHFIREWRKERGLTQVQLAEKADVTQAMISRVESFKPYDEEFLERVAIALNVTPADLIMRAPVDPEGLWSIHDGLSPVQRTQLVEMAKVLKRTGSNG